MPTLTEAVTTYEAQLNAVVGAFVAANTAASGSATAAADSASTASTQAGIATTKAGEALASKNAAGQSAIDANAIKVDLQTNWGDKLATATSKAAESTASAAASEASRQASGVSAGLAATAKTQAETARDVAAAAGKVYATTAAGISATTTTQYFWVPSASALDVLMLYQNVGGVATDTGKRTPGSGYFEDLYKERLFASRAASLERKRTRPVQMPKAAVVVLLGQSNNAPRGTPISGVVSPNVFMPAGGNSITYFPFNATNALWTCHWNDVATTVPHTEGTMESPASGVALGLLGGSVDRIYLCGAARGSSSFASLNSDGNIANLSAVLLKLCDKARADGYEPQVVFDVHHGESDSLLTGTEGAYFAAGTAYYRKVQAMAAIAMDKPDYDAPIVFHMPLAYGTFGSAAGMRNVAKAILRLSKGIAGGMLAGGSFQFLTNSDRVHQESSGMRQRGEQGGFVLRQYLDSAVRQQALQIVDAKWSGTTVTVLFSKEIVRDLALTYGTSLNVAYALGGLEFLDDAAYIKINAIAIQGRTAVLTLNAAPVGTVKTLQIASQTISGAATGSDLLPGTQIRAASGGFLSIQDYTKTYLDLAIPQTLEVRAA